MFLLLVFKGGTIRYNVSVTSERTSRGESKVSTRGVIDKQGKKGYLGFLVIIFFEKRFRNFKVGQEMRFIVSYWDFGNILASD